MNGRTVSTQIEKALFDTAIVPILTYISACVFVYLVQISYIFQAVDVGGEERGVGWHAY